MNIRTTPADNDAAAREWQAQEQATAQERHARVVTTPDAGAHDAARIQRYRMIARALQQPAEAGLPSNFAHRIAQQVAQRETPDSASDARFERNLLYLLIALFAIGAGVAIVEQGPMWLPALAAALPVHTLTNPWLLAFACCMGFSALINRWHHRTHE